MNIKIDIDITPDEMRKLMGLPDVDAFQRQLMDDIRERINEGVEGYDPLKLFQPYLSSSLAGMEMMQRLLTAGLGGSSAAGKDDDRG